MSTSEAKAAIPERLTWKEICRRHPDRWVVLVDVDWVNDTDFEFRGAEVIACHDSRKDASPEIKAIHAEDRQVGCFWTGEIRGPVPRAAVHPVKVTTFDPGRDLIIVPGRVWGLGRAPIDLRLVFDTMCSMSSATTLVSTARRSP